MDRVTYNKAMAILKELHLKVLEAATIVEANTIKTVYTEV